MKNIFSSRHVAISSVKIALTLVKIEYQAKDMVDCPKCAKFIHEEEIEILLGEEWIRILEEIQKSEKCPKEGFVRCRCGEDIKVVKHKTKYDAIDDQGKTISREAAEHLAMYKTKCKACKDDFCAKCMVNPYHFGFTCPQHREHVESDKCRYCGVAIKKKRKRGILQFVCSNLECKKIAKQACPEVLECGHICNGTRKEEECLPCLEPECVKDDESKTLGETKDSNCLICFSDTLGSQPCVQLECKHIFHIDCMITKMEMKWFGPRIHFAYKKCPVCKADIQESYNKKLQILLDEANELEAQVRAKAVERGKLEGLDKDERLKDEQDDYFENYEEYCLDRLAYYICFRCQHIYYGGMRECGNALENPEDYKPEDYACEECRMEDFAGKANCDIHGDEFIEWKCRYCCNYSRYFCGGCTHYCDPCHSRCNATPKKCPGLPECQILMDHPSDGTEFAMGCALCKNEREH
ncbi:unnamed protein product [Moneuplotes crassus]|uniref:RING-type domain-containing protein n=1 Tax=Euplotes crassus TaxID=5936 RepID=A0AAD1XW87_EUPCR|nr:unnamed protein product [Moneuplotes crassus]